MIADHPAAAVAVTDSSYLEKPLPHPEHYYLDMTSSFVVVVVEMLVLQL